MKTFNYIPLDEKQLGALYKYLISVNTTEDTVEEVMEDDGGDKKVSFNFGFSDEEPVLDGYILKIDSKFYYRDTYDETEKEGHDELEIVNKNSIRLNSCFRYVHVGHFNKQRHDVDVFIGESENPKNCRAYTVTLEQSAHYTYHFNGGANDNFHVEDVDILVKMEKK